MENSSRDLSKLAIPNKSSEGPGSDRRWRWGALLLVLAALLLIFALFPRAPGKEEASAGRPAPAQQPLAAGAPSSTRLDASGYVVAQRKAAVSSKATGRIKELRVQEGDTVKKDDILAVLENDDMAALVAERQAFLASTRTRLKFSHAELDDARRNHERLRTLRAKAVASQSELDIAEARLKRAESDVEAVNANVNLAQAQLDKTNVDLSYSYIRAPFDGTVLTKTADIGEVVAPFGSSLNARAAVVTLADMSSLEVEADISEQHIAKLQPGLECSIRLDSYPDHEYRGKVHKIVPTVDRAKGTVLTKISFLELDSRVLPDMSAKVSFTLSQAQK